MKEFQAAAEPGELESNMGTGIMACSPADAANIAFSMQIAGYRLFVRLGDGEIQEYIKTTNGTPKLIS